MFDFKKLASSFKFAFNGLSYSLKENQNIKIHLIVAIAVLIFGIILGLSKYELFGIGFITIMVVCAEMINSAIEEVVNLLVNEHHREAKIAKDVSAGMVLLTAIFAVIVGLFIFIPHILQLLS